MPVECGGVHLVALQPLALRRGRVVRLAVRRPAKPVRLPRRRRHDSDFAKPFATARRRRGGGVSAVADFLPDERLHRLLRRYPRPARLAPPIAVRRPYRDTKPLGFVKCKTEKLHPFGRRELDRGHRRFVDVTHILLRRLLHQKLAAERTIRIEYRRRIDACGRHRLQIFRDAFLRHVAIHPVPPRPNAAASRRRRCDT